MSTWPPPALADFFSNPDLALSAATKVVDARRLPEFRLLLEACGRASEDTKETAREKIQKLEKGIKKKQGLGCDTSNTHQKTLSFAPALPALPAPAPGSSTSAAEMETDAEDDADEEASEDMKDGEDEDGEAEEGNDDEDAPATVTFGSFRGHCLHALLAGMTSKCDVIDFVMQQTSRPAKGAENVLSGERNQQQPLWTQSGGKRAIVYALTAEGEAQRTTEKANTERALQNHTLAMAARARTMKYRGAAAASASAASAAAESMPAAITREEAPTPDEGDDEDGDGEDYDDDYDERLLGLLKTNGRVDPKDPSWSLLHAAAAKGAKPETVTAILATQPALVRQRTFLPDDEAPVMQQTFGEVHGELPLHLAAREGHTELCRLLHAAYPASAVAQDSIGGTPLHNAAEALKLDTVRLLLELAPQAVPMCNRRGKTAYNLACLSKEVGKKEVKAALKKAMEGGGEAQTPQPQPEPQPEPQPQPQPQPGPQPQPQPGPGPEPELADEEEVVEIESPHDHAASAPVAAASEPFDVEQGGEQWQKLDLICALSRESLTEPAKVAGCSHLACCNFGPLSSHVPIEQRCPVVGCDRGFRRARVEVDEWLKAQLEPFLRDGVTRVEVLHGRELRRAPLPSSRKRPAETEVKREDKSR